MFMDTTLRGVLAQLEPSAELSKEIFVSRLHAQGMNIVETPAWVNRSIVLAGIIIKGKLLKTSSYLQLPHSLVV